MISIVSFFENIFTNYSTTTSIPDALRSGASSVGQPCGIQAASAACPGNVTSQHYVTRVGLISYSLQGRDSDFRGAEWKYVLSGE